MEMQTVRPPMGAKSKPHTSSLRWMSQSVLEDAKKRFWKKVSKSESCWLWIPGGANDYGRIDIACTHWLAHRFSYCLHVGDIPLGMTLDHLCRVRKCVNYTHLEVVTNRENVLRGIGLTATNAKKTSCPRGHSLAGSNLYISPDNGRHCALCRYLAKVKYLAHPKGRS